MNATLECDNPRLRAALALLLQAHDCAQQLGRAPRDLPLGLGELRDQGVLNLDLVYLSKMGYVAHVDPAHNSKTNGDWFAANTRFFLTEEGVRRAGRLNGRSRATMPIQPDWDGKELRVGPFPVKRFRRPAEDQEMLLNGWQQRNWIACMDKSSAVETGQKPQETSARRHPPPQ